MGNEPKCPLDTDKISKEYSKHKQEKEEERSKKENREENRATTITKKRNYRASLAALSSVSESVTKRA